MLRAPANGLGTRHSYNGNSAVRPDHSAQDNGRKSIIKGVFAAAAFWYCSNQNNVIQRQSIQQASRGGPQAVLVRQPEIS